MALTTSISAAVSATYSLAAEDLQTAPSSTLGASYAVSLASGTGASQADKIWSNQATITTAATLTLDLAGGLTDVFGAAVTFVNVRGLYVKSAAANTTVVTLTRPANGVPFFSATGDSTPIVPGGVFLMTWPTDASIVVTAATGDLIDLVNAAGASAIVDIVIIGTSA